MARPAAILPVATDEHWINFLIHGEPGVGKSTLAGTSERGLLLLNNNDEASSAASHGSKCHKWVVPDYATMEEAYQYMLHEGCQYYNWVWIDNGTLLQEQAMFDEIMPEALTRNKTRSLWVPDQREYLINQNQLATYIRRFVALPIHFGITFHTMQADDLRGERIYLPMIQGGQGALAQKICGYMNAVGYMYVQHDKKGQHRRILMQKRLNFYAKTRWKGVPPGVEDLTIPKLEAMIRNHYPHLGQPPGANKAPAAKKTATTSQRRTA